ncbi:MAG: aldo/keto reductase [Sphingobacteriaceae bacterium]|nr:aldo/keto reductase [Cytophagaceae bacterium]
MNTIKKVALGSQGLNVSVEGLGCMGMSGFAGGTIYGPTDDNESIATIHRALELGVTMLDTADVYGPLHNEQLVGKAIAGKRDQFTIATKFGFEIDDDGNWVMGSYNGRPEYVRKSVERSLKNLGTDSIDLYYLHRMDPNIPIEETVGAMGRLVEEGKVRYLGLSEVPVDILRRAHAVHPITALQTEYSLFDRGVEESGVLEATREMGIGFVGYSPLGRGFLSGEIKSPDDFEPTDSRRMFPRYQGENFYKNLTLVEELKTRADAKGVTPAQLALAWVLAQGIVAIPGTKRRKYLEANVAAADLTLSPAERAELEAVMPVGSAVGAAYPTGL